VSNPHQTAVTPVIGRIPNRLALAGGWIEQPFVSRHLKRAGRCQL